MSKEQEAKYVQSAGTLSPAETFLNFTIEVLKTYWDIITYFVQNQVIYTNISKQMSTGLLDSIVTLAFEENELKTHLRKSCTNVQIYTQGPVPCSIFQHCVHIWVKKRNKYENPKIYVNIYGFNDAFNFTFSAIAHIVTWIARIYYLEWEIIRANWPPCLNVPFLVIVLSPFFSSWHAQRITSNKWMSCC